MKHELDSSIIIKQWNELRYLFGLNYPIIISNATLCGSTLQSLDLSSANITGENQFEYDDPTLNMITLPCLTDLYLYSCIQLSDKGRTTVDTTASGSKLKYLNIILKQI